MSRIETCFAGLRETGEKALIPFVTAGDPHPDTTVSLMHTLVEAGANAVELGVPFSDPMADGPVIQRANERALRYRTSLKDVLSMVEAFRKSDDLTPVILMGYLNPIETMGSEEFARAAATAGVDGTIIVDMPPEEGGLLLPALQENGIDPVFLLAPTTTEARTRRICDAASGFLYYVSLRGVTGATQLDFDEVESRLRVIRTYSDLPVGVGFGINSPHAAARVSRFADAVVVGSAIVNVIDAHRNDMLDSIRAALFDFVRSLRVAIDGAGSRVASGL